jgi:hypothetical protein
MLLRRTAKGGSNFKYAERWNESKPETPRDTEISTGWLSARSLSNDYRRAEGSLRVGALDPD